MGTPRPAGLWLIETAERTLEAGIAAPDGWTLCTNDGSRAAHVEHTVAITDQGPRILTARQPAR